MAVAGRKPKEDGQKVTGHALTQEWVDVVDRAYTGKRPTLPTGTSQQTRAWWDRVTKAPHCILWRDGDWQFALDTARIHNGFIAGDMARAAELRIRENQMGTTLDARRDLRIRYVPAPSKQATTATAAPTDFEAERKKRLLAD
jgi:hypothetical protein